ncbi:MAG: hypothetical protein L6R39_003034 [Caloplaca ligustica]|nr:MAG: hypothetical protein L6R39_003034 [Caloplaca ligustica]
MGVTFEAQAPPSQPEAGPNPPRPFRPNYNKLYAQPLPIKTYPLPPLIPHNPLSLLQIAFTYFFQFIIPPSSHPAIPLRGDFSVETRSIHIADEATARVLWEQGFFGKGSLSRSEPAWLAREKIRQGLVTGNTSEELTRKRREERKQFKEERARKEREVIEEKLAEEANAGSNGAEDGKHISEETNGHTVEPGLDRVSFSAPLAPNADQQKRSTPPDMPTERSNLPHKMSEPSSNSLVNQEHLQLTLEEAFYLVYGLGVLEIQNPATSQMLPTSEFFSICRSFSYFPPRPLAQLSPDDPFLLSYVVYHHFRSLGWVVRPGIKFAVDYLLYNRGPVFSHAEFAVMILPSYSHAHWSSTPELRAMVDGKEKKSWWWLHCVNRVQAQVRKSLVIAYVEVPPLSEIAVSMDESGEVVDICRFLKMYRVREVVLKRWTPNRSRD